MMCIGCLCICRDSTAQEALAWVKQLEDARVPTDRPQTPVSLQDATPTPSQRRHLLVSGRFNSSAKMQYMKRVKELLDSKGVPTFMVDAGGAGGTFGDQTALGLYRAKALLAFCTEDYGAKTGAQYETYVELKYAYQKQLRIIPIRLCETYPPQPEDEAGRAQNDLVLQTDLVRIEDVGMQDPDRVAQEICDAFAFEVSARADLEEQAATELLVSFHLDDEPAPATFCATAWTYWS
ncbi:unnamed protein product [Symbiodinium natans]|uniref:TIR domain-containing protein n=1 Tax=Symbiodinium natans TaxID=878477 RepID=A0A812MEW8_9DINO|nr:unnamed protein product [Symbiodinium natans]